MTAARTLLCPQSATLFTPGCKEYEDIKRLAATLARKGCTVVTGGGPGLMQAANEGAREGAPDHPERSVGIRIALEFEQGVNPWMGPRSLPLWLPGPTAVMRRSGRLARRLSSRIHARWSASP
mgnify:CR=1 FL=1